MLSSHIPRESYSPFVMVFLISSTENVKVYITSLFENKMQWKAFHACICMIKNNPKAPTPQHPPPHTQHSIQIINKKWKGLCSLNLKENSVKENRLIIDHTCIHMIKTIQSLPPPPHPTYPRNFKQAKKYLTQASGSQMLQKKPNIRYS